MCNKLKLKYSINVKPQKLYKTASTLLAHDKFNTNETDFFIPRFVLVRSFEFNMR